MPDLIDLMDAALQTPEGQRKMRAFYADQLGVEPSSEECRFWNQAFMGTVATREDGETDLTEAYGADAQGCVVKSLIVPGAFDVWTWE